MIHILSIILDIHNKPTVFFVLGASELVVVYETQISQFSHLNRALIAARLEGRPGYLQTPDKIVGLPKKREAITDIILQVFVLC